MVYHKEYFDRRVAKGLPKYSDAIKASRTRQNLNRKAKIRAELDEYKLEMGCVDCGYNKHAIALDFDHLPQFEKDLGISIMVARGFGMEKIWEEINKCEVVCSNCHRVRTQERHRGIDIVGEGTCVVT